MGDSPSAFFFQKDGGWFAPAVVPGALVG